MGYSQYWGMVNNMVYKKKLDSPKSLGFLISSCAIILVNIHVIPIEQIAKKATGLTFLNESVATIVFWFIWFYLFLHFLDNYRMSGINIPARIAKEFDRQLAKFSRRKKEKISPNLNTPQYLVSTKSRFKLHWECKYCQVTTIDLEPSVTINIRSLSTIFLFFIGAVKVILELPTFLHFFIPSIIAFFAILSQLVNVLC